MLIKCRYSFSQIYNIIEAVKLVKQNAKAKFDETIDFQLKLNVDPKHGDQAVRGNCILPGGLGKKVIVAVFVDDQYNDLAIRAGADIVGQEVLLNQIKEGNYKFDKLITTNDMMAQLKQYARTLGPKGLMPNPKAGTLVNADKLLESIKGAKAGTVEFRVDSGRNLMIPVGKVSFEDNQILRNIRAFSVALNERRPISIKGALINSALLKSTMGSPLGVEIGSFDQKNKENAIKEFI